MMYLFLDPWSVLQVCHCDWQLWSMVPIECTPRKVNAYIRNLFLQKRAKLTKYFLAIIVPAWRAAECQRFENKVLNTIDFISRSENSSVSKCNGFKNVNYKSY